MPPQTVPVAEVNAKVAQLQDSINAAQARGDALQAQNTALIEQKTTENAELTEHITALQAAYDDLVNNPQVPNETLDALNAAITDLDTWNQAPSDPIPDVPVPSSAPRK